jgi:hypothetical protein
MASKAHRPPHRNPWTGERLENKVQICPACHKNFGTTEAGDSHRIGEFGVDRRCIGPEQAKLVPIENPFGSIIWRSC